ncbi:MAG: glycosyltransferase family 4 protein [Lachnospiraceae bacterium]|jgi:glycosyltransferase involved in cell wall biosynthesis|nr:glycosyltransferase family 4 protein [Lachnospiraceae bacterium]
MKGICFLIGDMSRSGGTERVTAQVSKLLREEYRVHILSVQTQDDTFFYPVSDNVKTDKIRNHPRKNIQRTVLSFGSILRYLIRYVRKNQIDIIVDVDSILDIFSLPVKLFHKVKVVSWEHFPFGAKVGTGFRPIVARLSARYADACVVLTKTDYEKHNAHSKGHRPIIYIPNMVFPTESLPNKDSKRILSIGRLTQEKGFDYLVEVAKTLLPKYPDWEWIIVGEGEEREFLTAKIKEYHLENRLHLVGRQRNVESYYESSAIYVMTSRFEGAPMVLLEALGYHLPVVSFDCATGPAEMIEEGKCGYLIPCFDVAFMERRLEELITHPDTRVAFSQSSLIKLTPFLQDSVHHKWRSLLEELL